MIEQKEERKLQILSRLKKVEGQVKGIQKMVDEGKCYGYIKECIPASYKNDQSEKNLDELIDTIVKYVK